MHHSGELGTDAESIESTRMGTIDLIFAGTSGFTSFYEKAKVLDLPFLFDSAEQAYEVTNSEIGEQIFSDLRSTAWSICRGRQRHASDLHHQPSHP